MALQTMLSFSTTQLSALRNDEEEEDAAMPGPIAPFKRKSYSRSSEKKRHSNLFDGFAAIQGCPKIAEYTLESINEKDENGNLVLIGTFECYATYVLDQRQTTKGKTDEMYKCEGYDKMFATPKTVLAEKFKGEEWLQKGHPKNSWWADLYSDFKIRNRVQCLENGAPLEESTESITRKQFILISDGLMRGVHNKSGVAEAKDIEVLAAMNCTRAAVGRSGESGLITIDNNMSWSEQWDIDWGEMKKGASTKIGMYHDVQEFLICPYYGTIALLIARPRLHDTNPMEGEPKWLFPMLANYVNGGAAGKITKVIHDICQALGNVEGLHDKLVGHGLRAGAADDILLSVRSLDNVGILLGAIFRGGWEFVSECVLLRYLFKKRYIALAGKILAGYDVPEQDAVQPSLQVILESPDGAQFSAKISNLALLIFAGEEWGNHLRPLRDCLLATAFLHHQELTKRYGTTHLIAKNLVCFCSQVGIPESKIEEWGQIIRTDVDCRRNENRLVALRYKGDSSYQNSLLEEQNKLLREEMELLRANQRAQAEEMKQLLLAQQARDQQVAEQHARNQALIQQLHGMMTQLVKGQAATERETEPMETDQDDTAAAGTSPTNVVATDTMKTVSNVPPPPVILQPSAQAQVVVVAPTQVQADLPSKKTANSTSSLATMMMKARTNARECPAPEAEFATQQGIFSMKATAFLETVRRRSINLEQPHPLNPLFDRRVNARARLIFRNAIRLAASSPDPLLKEAAKYLGSTTPIDKEDDAAIEKALKVLPSMSSLVVNNLNRVLIAEYEKSHFFKSKVEKEPESKRKDKADKLVKALKTRLKPGLFGKLAGVMEETTRRANNEGAESVLK